MEKAFYLSKSFWGSVVLVITTILPMFGLNLEKALLDNLVDSVFNALIAIQAVVGLVLVVWGRLTAKQPVGLGVVGKIFKK
jgi:protein-S-isoprenylcysteine O-methyltransferase Ste14